MTSAGNNYFLNKYKNREVLREHYTSELQAKTRSNPSNKIDRKFINKFTAIVEMIFVMKIFCR
jgi:hypothetical protein